MWRRRKKHGCVKERSGNHGGRRKDMALFLGTEMGAQQPGKCGGTHSCSSMTRDRNKCFACE